ncbi:A/G-specific adenine glycosylase [Acetonema longum]|uniref:Adenine DNA glycosylase n=1 Tax=Acetonema longum DSM 6540 TaxID=1009370 RepID=F7NQC6_9FIRM|nr:A/G-specific adenine glycosylase [Acetonema longum]EGO61767.1 A/G-specific adenine glycosylase [Acetonema longum DSM 6540]
MWAETGPDVGEAPEMAAEISGRLLDWYNIYGRKLPWRQDKDPYKVWVSEVMLQQTRVEAVIPYYERFIARFPTLEDLAAAPEEAVLHEWQGLGYYSRARNLHQGVREVQAQYGGQIPANRIEISGIRGIGDYTAGALLSIIHNQPEPAVDGNVLRVFSRLFAILEAVDQTKTKKRIAGLVKAVMPQGRAGDFNQAVMDLGSAVCIPGEPRCQTCPLQNCCIGYVRGLTGQLPVKRKKKDPIPVQVAVGVLESEGSLLVRKRPDKGMLAGMWEFPTRDMTVGDPGVLLPELFRELNQELESWQSWRQFSHIFSHRAWHITAYRVRARGKRPLPQTADCLWLDKGSLSAIPFGGPHRKIAGWLTDEAGDRPVCDRTETPAAVKS